MAEVFSAYKSVSGAWSGDGFLYEFWAETFCMDFCTGFFMNFQIDLLNWEPSMIPSDDPLDSPITKQPLAAS